MTDTTFDPTKLSKNENFGIVPSNTTLTVIYRSNNPTESNLGVGSLNAVSDARMDFEDRSNLSNPTVQTVVNSLEINMIPSPPRTARLPKQTMKTLHTECRLSLVR